MSTNIQPVDLMSPGANLEAYIQAVNTIPLLSVEEEKELAEKLYYDADLDGARRLVMSHLRFVVYVAKSYSGYGLSEADLIQEGALAGLAELDLVVAFEQVEVLEDGPRALGLVGR